MALNARQVETEQHPHQSTTQPTPLHNNNPPLKQHPKIALLSTPSLLVVHTYVHIYANAPPSPPPPARRSKQTFPTPAPCTHHPPSSKPPPLPPTTIMKHPCNKPAPPKTPAQSTDTRPRFRSAPSANRVRAAGSARCRSVWSRDWKANIRASAASRWSWRGAWRGDCAVRVEGSWREGAMYIYRRGWERDGGLVLEGRFFTCIFR